MKTTSENIYPPANLWRRFAAMFYDFLLIIAISFLYYGIAIAINVLFKGIPEQGKAVDWGQFKFLVFMGWLASMVGFFCFFWKKSGQTLGMKTWHIKILNRQNQYPDFKQSFLRCLIAPFSFLLLGIGYWWVFTNQERQTLHDKLTKTKTLLIRDSN